MAAKTIYLVAYNTVSLLLWDYLTLYAVAGLTESVSETRLASLYSDLMPVLAATQTLAVLEVLHAVLGLVRASPVATATQIGGKNLVVWTVMVRFPELMTGSLWGLSGFMGCVLAWGCSEIIRYGYFAVLLTTGNIPGWFQWLRYNTFLVLYPIGLFSEAALVYLSVTQATDISQFYRGYLLLGLIAYIPLGPFLYTHMLSQRRKVSKKLSQNKGQQ